MAEQQGKSKPKSSSGRMMFFVLGAVVIAVLGGFFALKMLTADTKTAAVATTQTAPESDRPATGENADPRYAAMIKKYNDQQAENALRDGTSAAPSLLGSTQEIQTEDIQGLKQQIAQLKQANRKLEKELQRAERIGQANRKGSESYFYADGNEFMTPEYAKTQRDRIRDDMVALEEGWALTGSRFQAYAAYKPESTNTQRAPDSTEPRPTDSALDGTGASNNSGSGAQIVPAGSIMYATLDLEANSDVPGPIRATVHQQGELNGAHLLGSFSLVDEYLVMKFNQIVMPDGSAIPANIVAVDPDLRLAAVSDEVDHHYLSRFGALFAAAFLQGYGEAVLESQKIEVLSESGETATVSAIETTEDKAFAALANVGDEIANVVRPYAQRPITVVKYAGSGVGLLFLDEVRR